MGVNIRSMVRKAARLAVYDDMMINVKNHQALPMIRPANDLQPNNVFTISAGLRIERNSGDECPQPNLTNFRPKSINKFINNFKPHFRKMKTFSPQFCTFVRKVSD